MEIMTLADMKFIKAAFQERVHIAVEDVQKAAQLLHYESLRGFETKREAELYAVLMESIWEERAVIFECHDVIRFWVGSKCW